MSRNEVRIVTNSPDETRNLGVEIGKVLSEGDVICLTGNLGAGKTAFVSGVAKGLLVLEHVTSPTFTIVNEYMGRIPFFHFDVYRVYDPDELYDMGFEEYFYRGGAVCIEWANLIEDILPERRLDIEILYSSDDETNSKRTINFTWKSGAVSESLNGFLLLLKKGEVTL